MLKKITLLLGISLLSLPLCAYADLTVINDTNRDAAGKVNDSICSGNYGDKGLIHAHTSVTVPENQLMMGCGSHLRDCKADIYMTNDCSGDKAGTIIFDVASGITHVESSEAYILLAANPYQVQIYPSYSTSIK